MGVDSKAPCPLDKGGDLPLLLSSPSSIWRGVSSVPSDSRACSSSLKSTNSPEVAAVAVVVNHHSTNERQVRDLSCLDRRTPMKVLVKKSYRFTDKVWAAYLASNAAILRFVYSTPSV